MRGSGLEPGDRGRKTKDKRRRTEKWLSSLVLRRWSAVALAWVLVALVTACVTAISPTPSILRIAGSTSMEPLLRDLAQAFSSQHPDVSLDIQGGDTALGLELLTRGEVDMAAASWLPTDMPTHQVATPIAWDGLAIIVHPDNPLEELTLLQLRQLFAGWASRWQDVGAPVVEEEGVLTIQMLSREDGSGTRAVFEQQVMGGERVTFAARVMPTSQAVVDYVADHPNAIGYVSMALADSRVKVLRVEGLAPGPETVRRGYHLARPFYLVTRGRPTGYSRTFIDFVLSPAGQSIVGERYGRIR